MGFESMGDNDLPQIDRDEAIAILEKGKQLFVEYGKGSLPEKPDMDISCLVIATTASMIHDLGFPPHTVGGGAMNSLIKIATRAAYRLGERDAMARESNPP